MSAVEKKLWNIPLLEMKMEPTDDWDQQLESNPHNVKVEGEFEDQKGFEFCEPVVKMEIVKEEDLLTASEFKSLCDGNVSSWNGDQVSEEDKGADNLKSRSECLNQDGLVLPMEAGLNSFLSVPLPTHKDGIKMEKGCKGDHKLDKSKVIQQKFADGDLGTQGDQFSVSDRQPQQQKTLIQTTGTGQKPLTCNEHSDKFSHGGDVKSHNSTLTETKPFICYGCGKGFSRRKYLMTHTKIHTGVKPFICDECDKGFTLREQLKSHKRTHVGQKSLICEECDKRFSRAGDLKKHKRTHTGEKPFICDDCGRGFRRGGHLKTHKLIHTGEKPFICVECSKRFNRRENLKKHRRTRIHWRPVTDVLEIHTIAHNQERNHSSVMGVVKDLVGEDT